MGDGILPPVYLVSTRNQLAVLALVKDDYPGPVAIAKTANVQPEELRLPLVAGWRRISRIPPAH